MQISYSVQATEGICSIFHLPLRESIIFCGSGNASWINEMQGTKPLRVDELSCLKVGIVYAEGELGLVSSA